VTAGRTRALRDPGSRVFCDGLNLPALGARHNSMGAFYAVLFALFVAVMGGLEMSSSQTAARIADEPDRPSACPLPALAGRWPLPSATIRASRRWRSCAACQSFVS